MELFVIGSYREAPKRTLLLRNGMRAIAKYDCDYLSSSMKLCTPLGFFFPTNLCVL